MNLSDDKVLELLKDYDEDIYLVGGAVRDYFLGKTTCDKDILVSNAEEFAIDFAKKNDATFITLDSENKIYRVVLRDKINYVDITEPIEGSLEKDLRRRDFTINSIAINLKTNEIIDINNGQEDIKNKVIRSISENNLVDDPLRILRAFRFAATLGFNIESKTLEQINRNKNLILKPAKERINYEILKLFQGKYTAKVLLTASDIIELLYPEFKNVKKVPSNTHHHLGLYEHSVETVNQIQKLYENSSDEIKSHLDKVDFGGFSRLAHLKFAGFFHDIGKFSTWTIEGDRHRFIKHDDVGSKMAKEILKQNKFSKKQIEYITSMIKNHIYPSQVVSSEEVTDKIYMRYIRKMNDDVIDNIILAQADRLSARGPAITDEIVNDNISRLNKLLEFYLMIKPKLKPLPKLLTGEEIMDLKNIQQSPKLGEIISALKNEQLEGNILTKDDAVKFVLEYKV